MNKTKIKQILKFMSVSILTLGLAAYLLFAMVSMSDADVESVCNEVVFNFLDDKDAGFVNKKNIEDVLKSHKLYPKGMLMNNVDTRMIESLISENNFIKEVQCYKSIDGKFCIDIKQRKPVVYILPENATGYFIDEDGDAIPNTNYASNLVTVTGCIDSVYAQKELSIVGNILKNDEFWNNQIEQIHISFDSDGKRVAEFVPRVGNHIVYLGTLDDFNEKLNRLKVFYSKAITTVGWNKYERISVEYSNQIICTKHKK